MAWLPTPTGRTAAEYPLNIQGGGSFPSYLLNRPNPTAEVVKAWLPALKEYLAQKRADDIANQYLNMEQPPRAEAVDPSAYDPQLALRQGLNSQTAPQATAPNTGGERAYKADVLYRSLLNEQADRAQKTENSYWQNEVHKAQAKRYNAEAESPGMGRVPRYPITLPDGSTVYVTGNEAAKQQNRFSDIKALTGKNWSDWNNLAENDLAHIQTDGSGNVVGEFVAKRDKDGNPIAYEKRSMPVQLFKQAQERARKAAGQTAEQEQMPPQEPDLPPVEKQLDAATAKEILAEAGGDKEKARQIARQRGYEF